MPLFQNRTYELQLVQQQQGVTFSNLFYVSPDAEVADDNINGEIEELATNFHSAYKVFQSDQVNWVQAVLRDPLDQAFPARARALSGLAGDIAAEPLPTTCAVILRQYAFANERTRHGRLFLGGVSSSLMEQGQLTNPGILAFGALVDQVKTIISGNFADYEIFNFSRVDQAFYLIFRANIDPTIRSYRSRYAG